MQESVEYKFQRTQTDSAKVELVAHNLTDEAWMAETAVLGSWTCSLILYVHVVNLIKFVVFIF